MGGANGLRRTEGTMVMNATDDDGSSGPNVSLLARLLSSSHRVRGVRVVALVAALALVGLLVGALAFYPTW